MGKLWEFIKREEKQARERGDVFSQSMAIETVESSLKKGKHLPVTLILEGEVLNTDLYDVAESLYTLTFEGDELILKKHSDKNISEKPIIIKPEKISVDIIKSTIIDYKIENRVYTRLTINNGDDDYHFVWSGVSGLEKLSDYFIRHNLSYTLPIFYRDYLFSATDVTKELVEDDRIERINHNLMLFPR